MSISATIKMRTVLLATVAVLLCSDLAHSCSWAHGYFYQVTRLKGSVVGAKIGPLQYLRPLRQAFARKSVKLDLYEYRWPAKSMRDVPLIRIASIDSGGHFDFGPLDPGHYTLVVEDEKWHDSSWFDVEIGKFPMDTASVTIDISPNFPDCRGGHTFIVRTR
jgi:hypothetical protein